MSSGPVGVAVIGAGVISQTYIEHLTSYPDVRVVAVGDLFPAAAQTRAAQFGIADAGDVDFVLQHPDVEIVVNLTTPAAHVPVATAALQAGKHVWNEKPLALDRESGAGLLALAEQTGLRVGCAPDTFLGPGLQTARRLIERGDIGTPLTALTMMQDPGPDRWHPNPAFLFQAGGGPLLDMGPYYLTALVQVFGSIARVASLGSQSRASRSIGMGPHAGQTFSVDVPTHVSALLQFESGGHAQSTFSFDSPLSRHGFIEITGSEGTLALPDPNAFNGDLVLTRTGSTDADRIAVAGSATTITTRAPGQLTSGRGLGVLDMARSIRAGVPHRAQGRLALHVLDAMLSIGDSIESGTFVEVPSRVAAVPALDADFDPTAGTLS